MLHSEVQQGFVAVLGGLTEKEQSVIKRRIGFDSNVRETLQAIGDDNGITRERVRQIEDVAIRKIGRIVKSSNLLALQASGEKILAFHGGLLTKDKLLSAVIQDVGISGPVNEGIIETILQSDFNIQKSKPQLGTHTYFTLPEVNKKVIGEIHKEALKILKKRGDIIENTVLHEMIKINLFAQFGKVDTVLIDSALDIFMDIVKGEEKFIGLEKWKILNPSTLKDKAIYILKKNKEAMHFVDITNAIADHFKESVKVATIHNELIRNNEFVLIGRGIYVLKEWGYRPGTVLDVILDIFQKAKTALSTEDIVARVLKVRQVKTSTIYMNLQNRQYIERVGRNMYQVKQ
ncbi:MAG: sigma factor-like helix-turn-helix DNA-binding protein [Patescibacteria group bacterium]